MIYGLLIINCLLVLTVFIAVCNARAAARDRDAAEEFNTILSAELRKRRFQDLGSAVRNSMRRH